MSEGNGKVMGAATYAELRSALSEALGLLESVEKDTHIFEWMSDPWNLIEGKTQLERLRSVHDRAALTSASLSTEGGGK
jgi:hypothetical protein